MSRNLLHYKGIITDSQALDGGSIPLTRSSDFNGLARTPGKCRIVFVTKLEISACSSLPNSLKNNKSVSRRLRIEPAKLTTRQPPRPRSEPLTSAFGRRIGNEVYQQDSGSIPDHFPDLRSFSRISW